LRGEGEAEKAFAVASATLAAANPEPRAAALRAALPRAEAYAVFLRLEGAAFPPRGVTAMADAAAASFGNLDRASYVLPPFGWIFFAGFACSAAVAVLAIRMGLQGRKVRQVGASRTTAVLATAASVVILGLGVVSVLERTSPRFVSLGGTARSVPSELAAEGETVEAGRTGRVLESTADWSFVEFDEGGAVWLSAHDVVTY
jgi:hypothetical protein